MFDITLVNGIEISIHAFERIGEHEAIILAYTGEDEVQPWVTWILDTDRLHAYTGDYYREYWRALEGYRKRAEFKGRVPGLNYY